jgi:hypothetical protein
MMETRNLTVAYWVVVFLGVTLWLVNWWANRPLFIDEANVARNLFDRSFSGLFLPLDHQQYAPPLYLVMAKGCGELFGYGERVLRLPSILGGLIAILGLTHASKQLDLKGWILLPLLLLFVNPTVLRFVGEIKPYSLDVGIASILLASALKDRAPSWKWIVTGMAVIWFSLPSTFVLAAVGLVALFESERADRWKWVGIAGSWVLSLAFLYFMVLRPSIGSDYLNNFHDPYFFSLPFTRNFDYLKSFSLLAAQPRLAFGFTVLAIVWSSIVLLYALVRLRNRTLALLILPVVIVFLASSLGYYSLITRLMLFTLPGWWLIAAMASREMSEALNHSGYYKMIPIILWGVTVAGTNVARHYIWPNKFSDSRTLVTGLDTSYTPIMDHASLPAYDYYHRIHPDYKSETNPEQPTVEYLSDQPLPGRYVMLYDVLTEESFRNRMNRDSIWAAKHGATEIRLDSFFRAAALYIDLPAAER